MHVHQIEDEQGELSDVIPFCSDSCHREWCGRHNIEYGGWNGAHEASDGGEYCANCGVTCATGEESCEHQRDNVLVNRFTTEKGVQCEHGNWIQLPRRMKPVWPVTRRH
jgi:hypothetical protein